MGIPTSYQAFLLAVQCGIPITTLDEHPEVDVTIDGADQVTPELNLIKGMGAALAREKIVAAASKLNVIIADEQKKVKLLGEKGQGCPRRGFALRHFTGETKNHRRSAGNLFCVKAKANLVQQ